MYGEKGDADTAGVWDVTVINSFIRFSSNADAGSGV